MQHSKEQDFLESLKREEKSGKPIESSLEADDRVLARISDGIYRQPASALRELIANAYDADAQHVIIHTDFPRFEHISIKDDGVGMDRETLVRMLHHIGGSPKRNSEGVRLGISAKENPALSPSGRKMIGKIGIGLFSVAQLSRHFQIITKRAGSKYRLIADIRLRVYSEDGVSEETVIDGKPVTTGNVSVRSVPAEDTEAHGTEIIIQRLHAPARDVLRSRDTWDRLETLDAASDETYAKPKFHIGKISPDSTEKFEVPASLPWDIRSSPEKKFRQMYDAVGAELEETPRPKLEKLFDRYLNMIWTLSLAALLLYIDSVHPFDLKGSDERRLYLLSNEDKKPPEEITLKRGETIRQRLGLKALEASDPSTDFKVQIDGVQLSRPISFKDLPGVDSSDPAKQAILFIGKYTPNLMKLPTDMSGGRELAFEAYLLWSPSVVPVDHNGVLVRIAGATGTMYDDTFLGYQVAEWNRLSKVSGEVFVLKGLDAALNIDRESFNFSHPHTKIISAWVHRALRQIANTRKAIEKLSLDERRKKETTRAGRSARRIAEGEARRLDSPSMPEVEFREGDDDDVLRSKRRKGIIILERDVVLPESFQRFNAQKQKVYEDKIKALAQILDAYGLFSRLRRDHQQALLNAIARLFLEKTE